MSFIHYFAITALVFVAVAFIVNKIMLAVEFRGTAPKGKMVSVPSGSVNVNIEGKGGQTIVILSGFGVTYPIGEYAPLSRLLSEKHTVATVDYLGMGFSSKATSPRTNENIVEDIRAALKGAGLKPPYFLLPHSVGGVYAQYYAIKHPEEIAGLILLDTTPTVSANSAMPRIGLYLSWFSQSLGQTRMQIRRMKKYLPYTPENGYTPEERKLLLGFLKRVYNKTMINQALNMPDTISQVEGMEFPQNMPVYKIISKLTYEADNPQLGMSPKEFQERHFAQLGNNFDYEIVDGPHMLHQKHSKEVARIAKKFIDKTVALSKR